MNALDSLKQLTTVVVDTADFHELAKYQARDATTNPSLILKAVKKPEYAPLLKQTVDKFRHSTPDELMDRLIVRFGMEILNVIPGRVSTEIDARMSFDSAATYKRGKRVAALYQSEGVPNERVLVKVAATWEGIRAARQLECEGIRTNLTLVFAFCQAVACAQANVQLISPFVGRIYDWHKKAAGNSWDEAANSNSHDPGVISVRQIYAYFKQNSVRTEVMGASFRNIGQVIALAGCDLLTVSPDVLNQLAASDAQVTRALERPKSLLVDSEAASYDASSFRFSLNEDAMATEKLAEGIRVFSADAQTLEALMN